MDKVYAKAVSIWRAGKRIVTIESAGQYLEDSEPVQYPLGEYCIHAQIVIGEGDICLIIDEDSRLILWDNTDYWVMYEADEEGSEEILDQLLTRRNRRGGYLNSKNYVGELDACSFGIDIPIEFISRKIGYEDDFNYLQTALTEIFYGLMDRGSSFFEQSFQKGEEILQEEKLPYSQIAYLKDLLRPGHLPEWLEYLIYHSEHGYLEETQVVYAAEADEITQEAYINALRPDNLRKAGGRWYPLEVECHKKTVSHDTPENRFIKFFLEFLLDFLEETIREQKSRNFAAGVKIKRELYRLRVILTEQLEHPFWRTIGSLESIPGNSQILQKKYPYQLLFQAYHNWELRPQLCLHELDYAYAVGQKDVPMLYQYFVYLKFFEYLCSQYPQKSVRTDFIHYKSGRMDFTLREGSASCAVFKLGEDRELFLYYNKTYQRNKAVYEGRSYSHDLKPDISLELYLGEALAGCLHFDAKYKIPDNGIEVEEDINKMHAYKDGIMGTAGAYAVCLSKENRLYVQEELGMRRDGQIFPSVGTFALHMNEETIERQLQDMFAVVQAFADLPADAERCFRKGRRRPFWKSS